MQGNKTILIFPVLNKSMHSHVCIPKISVCNQLLCHLLLECWIQRGCYYEMMCEKQYRMREWIHSSRGSPEEEAFQGDVWFGRCLGTLTGEARAGLIKKEGKIEKMSLFWVLKQPPSTGRAILGLEVTILCRGGDGGLGAGLWWNRACGTGRLCQWAAHMALLSQHRQVLGQRDKSQCSLPAMQLPSVLWHGPEGLLLLLTQVPQKISRKSYLKWKQSLQPGGMPCGEVSRSWLSQETVCQFGI